MGTKMIMLVISFEFMLSSCIKCEEIPKEKLKSKQETYNRKSLESLNRSSAKTMEYFGDLYDCVDFFKQPAFDNPLLKNHTFHHEMISKSFPKEIPGIVPLPDGGCPKGTVPIKKITNGPTAKWPPYWADKEYRAVIRTRDEPNKKYYGAKTTTSVYAPKVSVSGPHKISAAVISLGNGVDQIKAGWTVSEVMFAYDPRPRLYVHTKNKKLACYDNMCEQFIQVNPSLPLGAVVHPFTIPGHEIYETEFYIHRVEFFGQWWLSFGKNQTEIGYWPHEMFTDLIDFATYVEWGGGVLAETGRAGPEMGSGLFPSGDMKKDAYHINTVTVNKALQFEEPGNTVAINDDDKSYAAVDYGARGGVKRLMCFGGPGPKA